MLEKDGIAGDLGDVDGDCEALTGEDGVHDWDVLMREVAGDREDENAGEKFGGAEGLVGGVAGYGLQGGEEGGLLVDMRESEG